MKISCYFFLAFFTIVSHSVTAQNKPYKVSPQGVNYKIHKDAKGRNAVKGDVVEFNVVNRNTKDSILFNTYEAGAPILVQLTAPEYKGDIMSALSMLSAGDSATFWLEVDSLRDFEPIPGVLDKGSQMLYTVKVNGVYTMDEYTKIMEEAGNAQLKTDTLAIKEYFKANNIKNYKRTASGLYYVIDSKGPDANAKPAQGNKVKVHYTGTLLDGQKFDSSRDRGQPFEFTLGIGQVIKGWDEGIALLSKGSRGKLYIPSPLGYGAQGAGGSIPPNAILIFDVELLDF